MTVECAGDTELGLDAHDPPLHNSSVLGVRPRRWHGSQISERWRFVAFGDVGGVEGAFGVDAVGAVVCAGSATSGHHDRAITGWSINYGGMGYFAGGQTQTGKQRSEEHTSELQSLRHLVCRLLL